MRVFRYELNTVLLLYRLYHSHTVSDCWALSLLLKDNYVQLTYLH
jgi:hypothetical protein